MSDKEKFIAELYPASRRVSQETGMAWETILAQAAQETGWGQRVLPGTNNIFNIKAGGGWVGPTKNFNVWEIVDGKKVWMDQSFRAYSSVEEALRDRVQFLKENPRYTKAGLFDHSTLGNLEREADALQKAGYATDPNYAHNLAAVFNGRTMQRGIARAVKPDLELHARVASVSAPVMAGGIRKHAENLDETRHLQHLLNKLGYRDAFGHSLRVDGDFGDRSREAVHAFQQAHGLPQVDHVGPRTREALRSAERSPSPVDPSHPDHALYRQALAGVHRLDHEHGRAPDAGSDRLAASLTRLAKENGLIRVDHVVLSIDNGTVKRGENVFVVQGAMGDPAHRLAYMKTQVAIDAPVAESFRQLEQGNALQRQQAMQVEPLQASPRVHAQQPAAYAEGPRMVPAR